MDLIKLSSKTLLIVTAMRRLKSWCSQLQLGQDCLTGVSWQLLCGHAWDLRTDCLQRQLRGFSGQNLSHAGKHMRSACHYASGESRKA